MFYLQRKFISFKWRFNRRADKIQRLLHSYFLSRKHGIHVSPDSFVAKSAKLMMSPDGQYRGGNIQIMRNVRICEGALLLPYGGDIFVDEGVYIGPYCIIQSNKGTILKIGKNTLIAGHTVIVPSNHGFEGTKPIINQPVSSKGIIIHNDVWIGARVVILDGVEIGEGAVIGAGSTVTKNIPSFSIAAGNPARVLKRRE